VPITQIFYYFVKKKKKKKKKKTETGSLTQSISCFVSLVFVLYRPVEDLTGMNVLLLPIGACDDMAHSQNEKFNLSNYMNGIKLMGYYLHELGKIRGPKPSQCRCVPLTPEELNVPGAFMKGFKCKCEV
jgi:hypothetical protein